jgi:hypothetical protein
VNNLDRIITKALKERQQELFHELTAIADQLAVFDPPKPMRSYSGAQLHEAKIMEHASSNWMTSPQFARKTGMSRHATTRALNRLVEQNRLAFSSVNRVPHYKLAPQRIRIKVGYGELK